MSKFRERLSSPHACSEWGKRSRRDVDSCFVKVRVRALLERRVSAKELPAYLEEISVPEDLRPAARQQMTPPVSLRPRGSGRPTKRDRRQLDALDWG